jgi:DNA-binding IclR family transcriptional regulator
MSVPRTQSLTRAIGLLRALERFPNGAAAATLARATGLAPRDRRPTARDARDEQFVERGDTGWTVGRDVVRIAQRADPYRAMARRARPVLEHLAAIAGESAMLAIPRPGPGMAIVAQADGPRLLGLTNWVGRHIDLHASAAGKLVLAE